MGERRASALRQWSAAGLLTLPLRRREFFLWIFAILAASVLLRVRAPAGTPLVDAVLQSLASRSAFQYLAWAGAFWLLANSKPTPLASRADIAIGAGLSLLPFIQADSLSWISITALALYLLVTSPQENNTRAAAFVMLALAFNGLWGPQFFEFFAFPLLRADTAIVGAVLALTQPGFEWRDTIIQSQAHSIIVFGPCSSFHNISLSLLCWVTLTKLARPTWFRGDVLVALLVTVAVVVLNTVRLYLMALSPELFTYWHTGFGADLFAWSTPLVVMAISLWGILRKVQPA